MRANGRSPTSAITPPAWVANNSFKGPAISNFHCRNEDVNRAKPSHKHIEGIERLKLMAKSVNRENGDHRRPMGAARTAVSSQTSGGWTGTAVAGYARGG